MSASVSNPSCTDRNLLFGILALQLDFIGRDALIQAMNSWVLEKSKPLGQILAEQGALAGDSRALLDALVGKHLALHGNDPEQSLAAVSPAAPIRGDLEQIADPELHASLGHVPNTPLPEQNLELTQATTIARLTPTGARFQILRPHAKGGVGEVSVALDQDLHREVALKEIQARHAQHPESRARFLREAEITGGLEHPGIVPVYALGRYPDGRPFYAMRFVRGHSLREAIYRLHGKEGSRTDPWAQALELRQLLGRFVAVCNTIAYAHSRGVVHRDLKPSNIMLGAYGETLVVDWGLARPFNRPEPTPDSGEVTFHLTGSSDSDLTQVGRALGTPQFMSPEQAAGQLDKVGPASDVYSLGATLYCLVTGKAPFGDSRDSEFGQVLQKVQRGDFVLPHKINATVNPSLEAICLKAMALRPEDRYSSSRELAKDVEHWLGDEPVSAYREPWRLKFARWSRRHRPVMASATVALLLLMAGVVGGLALWESAEQRRRQQAFEYLADLRSSTEANEELGLADLRAGRFPRAEKIFQQAVDHIRQEPKLAEQRSRLESQLEQAHHLVEFYRLSNLAERLQIVERDPESVQACEDALKMVDVTAHPDWWLHLPVADLSHQQIEKLQNDVYRLLLLLGAIRAKEAIRKPGTWGSVFPVVMESFTMAKRYRPSRAAAAIELLFHLALGHIGQLKPLPPADPASPADSYFLGLFHMWLSDVSNIPLPPFLVEGAKVFSGLDFQNPLETSEEYLLNAARLEPQHYWTCFWLGGTLLRQKKFNAAQTAFNACVALEPDFPDGYFGRARVCTRKARFARDPKLREQLLALALQDCNRAVELDPENSYAFGQRGLAYQEKGDYELAVRDLTQALSHVPETLVSHDRSSYLVERATCYRLMGDFEKAYADFAEALRLYPKYAPAFFERGKTHSQKEELELALADYSEAIRIKPKDPDYLDNRGKAYAQLGQWNKSAEDFSACLKLNPDLAPVGCRLALARLAAGDVREFQKICEGLFMQHQKTQDPEIAAGITRICVLIPQATPQPGPLVQLAEIAVKGNAKRPDYQTTLGAALYRAKRFEEAIRRLDQGLALVDQAKRPVDWLYLAMAHHRLGHSKEANDYLAKAIQWIDRASQEKNQKTSLASLTWDQQLELKTLRAEAEGLLVSSKRSR